MITPEWFVNEFSKNKTESNIKLAKIDPNYSSGLPKVVYDSDIASGTLSKSLPHLSSYLPLANDRVMIVNGVIVGKVGGYSSGATSGEDAPLDHTHDDKYIKKGIAIPVHRRNLFHISDNNNNGFNTNSATWVRFGRIIYSPLGYALPQAQNGATRKYKIYVVYTDNVQATNTKPRVRLTNVYNGEFILPYTWGAPDVLTASRDWYSDFFTAQAGGHVELEARICDDAGTNPANSMFSIKSVDLIAYDIF